jgi:EmrB/QacA subfamily drug resistance transporter
MTATLDRPLVTAAPTDPTTARTDTSVRRGLGFAAVLGATVMDLLDSTVVGVAAPTIRADLGGSYAVMQWTSAGYTLALAVLLLVGGRLGDMVGRRRMLLVGVAGFAVSSLVCALAGSPEMLIGGRVLQGGFGALMLPQGFGLIRDLFPPAEMAKAWAAFGPVMGIGAILGPIVGGLLVHADLFGTGWRMIFLINLPIAVAVLAAARHLPAVAPTARGTRLDLPGIGLAGTGIVLLIFPLVQGHELGWPLWAFASMVAAAPVFAVFARRQMRLAAAGRAPLVEPGIFAKRSYVAGVGFAVVFLAAMGALFTVGVMLQIGLGFGPMQASLTMAPWALGALIGSAFAAMTMARLGRVLLHIGLTLMGIGVVGLAVAYQLAGAQIGFAALAGPLLVGGAGMGMIFVPMFDIILSGVAEHESGSASGALGALEQFGMTLGVAVLGTVFFTVVGPVPTPQTALQAGTITALVTLGLIVVAFAIGFALPGRVRAGAHS